MNVIDYITITWYLKIVRLQITFDYMENVINYNRLRLQITITPCLSMLELAYNLQITITPCLSMLELAYNLQITITPCLSMLELASNK
jgi:hypothetical protein